MFTYLHAYRPDLWEAQVRAGLVRERDGVRFCQNVRLGDDLAFNGLAARDGALYDLLRDGRRPMYIDRLQGGDFVQDYPYDESLLDDWRERLGENFWGFQMHEWLSNCRQDIRRILDCGCTEWTKSSIESALREKFPYPYLYLEAMNAAEFAQAGRPENLAEFLMMGENLFALRQRQTKGMLVPCDSYFLALPLEIRLGAKRIMPEIGAQTPDARLQLAYARGMARANKIPFGAYYEPWGGEPFSTCCYQREGLNEWQLGYDKNFPFEMAGPNGGSSRSLQWRLHLYAYMAGASFMAEEWGMCNMFCDWRDFELSPYGEVKREFQRFVEKYPDLGEPVAPIAVVLPKELSVLEGIYTEEDSYLGFPVEGSLAEKLRLVRTGLRALFAQSEPMCGIETATLRNCTMPDALDVVQEDCVRTQDYAGIVDLTGSAAFAHANRDKLCEIDEVLRRLEELLPCRMTGGAMKQLTRTEDGAYCVMLLNNSGVTRSVAEGERRLPEGKTEVRIQPKLGLKLVPLEGDGCLTRLDDGSYHVSLPAGGWFFARLA